MKKIIHTILTAGALLLVFSCTGDKAKFGPAIEDAVMANAPGDRSAYSFTILELKDNGVITVADSLQILQVQHEADHKARIESEQATLELIEYQQRVTHANRYVSDDQKQAVDAKRDVQAALIDSLRNSGGSFTAPDGYTDPSRVLVVIKSCTYSVTDPRTGKEVQESFDFYLSPDGKVCYTKKKIR